MSTAVFRRGSHAPRDGDPHKPFGVSIIGLTSSGASPPGTALDRHSIEGDPAMSQRHVERVIGKLATDESFRARFLEDPAAALGDLAADGIELNDCERRALLGIEPAALIGFADALDPRIQKSDLKRSMP
jgi:hypothetical protein